MMNGTWKRTTSAQRRANRRLKYKHISKGVGEVTDLLTGGTRRVALPVKDGTYLKPMKRLKAMQGACPNVPKIGKHDWLPE